MGVFAGIEPTWAARTDVGRTHIATKGIVQSGLVLNLDASASTSYPGSGTAWGDITGIGGISTATGALPIYNTTDNGASKTTGTRSDAYASSLVLAIPMDGANNGTTFTDESVNIRGSGSAKAITRFGDTKTLTAQSKYYGSSGFFDGTGDYLSIASSTDFAFGTGDFSFEFWYYHISGTDRGLFANNSGATVGVNFLVGVSGPFRIYNGTTGNNLVDFSASPVANTWQHIAVVRLSGTVTLYVNGVASGTGNWSGVNAGNTSTFSIGSAFGDARFANGYIQDLRVYKGVAKYTANFTPPLPNNGTLTNGPTYSSVSGGSLVFDGTNDYAQLTSKFNFGTGDFSMSCWVNFSTVSGDTNYRTILSSYASGGATDYIFGLYTTGVPKFSLYAPGANVNGNTTLVSNTWYNLVAVRASGIVSLYVNGILDNTPTSASGNVAENAIPMIGRVPSASQTGYLNGNIPQISVYNRALSATEVLKNYNALRNRFFDSDASSYIRLVEAADGQALEPAVSFAINDFVVGCKADGIWSAIKASCILAGARTLAGALVPLAGTAPVNVNFVSGDYNRKTGLIGNGSNKYLDADRLQNADPKDNYHLSIYASQADTRVPSATAYYLIGGGNPSFNCFSHIYAQTQLFTRIREPADTNYAMPGSSFTGFIGASRSSFATYSQRSSSTSQTISQSSNTPGAFNTQVFRDTQLGGAFSTNARLAFYSIGEAIDLVRLDTRITTLINTFASVI